MSWGIVASVGGSLVAGSMAADAAGSAADTQAAAADRAEAGVQRRFDQTRADYEPFRQSGLSANKRLSYLLGLSPGGGSAPGAAGGAPDVSATAARIRSAFPNWAGQGSQISDADLVADFARQAPGIASSGVDASGGGLGGGQSETINSILSDLNASQGQPTAASAAADPAYGSLLKKFSADDLNADPVYQSGLKFGLDQGTGGINARAIAGGGYDSGATLKALTRYAEDYGSTKANESRNRYVSDNDSIYNKLAGVSGTGQSATGQVAAAGTNAANTSAGLITDAGNARAAGIVGGANAWGDAASGISSGVNTYNTNQWLKSLTSKKLTPSSVGSDPYPGYNASIGLG